MINPVYTITANELTGRGAYSSEAINALADFLTEVKNLILDPTEDLERWLPHNRSVVIKLSQEFKYYQLFEYSESTLNTIITSPEFIWGLSRLRDNKIGVEYFFKMLNVPTMTQDIAKKPVLFYGSKDEVQNAFDGRESASNVHIDLSYDTNPTDKINALNIFTSNKVGVCTDYLIDFKLYSFKSILAFPFEISQSYLFETPMIYHDYQAVYNTMSLTVETDVNHQAVTETITLV